MRTLDRNGKCMTFPARRAGWFWSCPQISVLIALMLLASGLSLESLRHRIDASVFALLEASAERLSRENALAALKDQFGIEADETLEEEEAEPSVFGASLVNFPRRVKRKRQQPELADYSPISSPS